MLQSNIHALMRQFPNCGELVWIGVRPSRKQPVDCIHQVWADCETGLQGDHYAGRSRTRQVTLLQWEYLAVLESLLGRPVKAEQLRRNLLIRGLNINALKNRTFQIGGAIFKTTGLCHPCSRMEAELGAGGYNAMRNHGGITAQVIASGWIKTGDALTVLQQDGH